jgi:hypothetical protein
MAKRETMGRCECWDRQCPSPGHALAASLSDPTSQCQRVASVSVWRMDWVDDKPLVFCVDCATDALCSGVFATEGKP